MLEQQIAELNSNILNLNKLLARYFDDQTSIDAQAYREQKAIFDEPKDELVQQAKPAKESKPEPIKEPEPEATAPVVEPPAAAPVEVTYDDVKKLILDMSKKSRDLAVSTLGKFGASNGPSLKKEDYAAFVAEAKKALGE